MTMSNSLDPQSDRDVVSDASDSEDWEQETMGDYTVKGYHPVWLGDIMMGRYYILRKLGWGHFATVWLAYDNRAKNYAAIKVSKSDEVYREAAIDELQILRAFQEGDQSHPGAERIVRLLNHFDVYGIEKVHSCFAFEVLGDNLLTVYQRFGNLNIDFVRVVSKQLLEGLAFIHDCQIIHTDIKPENVVICADDGHIHRLAVDAFKYHGTDNNIRKPRSMVANCPEEYRKLYLSQIDQKTKKRMRRQRKDHRDRVKRFLAQTGDNANEESIDAYYHRLNDGSFHDIRRLRVKIVDFGNACYTNHHFTDDVQTREYRSPEVIIGTGYDTSADIWSSACLLYELACGDYLFDVRTLEPEGLDDVGLNDEEADSLHLQLMIEVLGRPPRNVFLHGRHYENLFDQAHRLRRISSPLEMTSLHYLLRSSRVPEHEVTGFTEFLLPMLTYDPNARLTAEEALNSPWLDLSQV